MLRSSEGVRLEKYKTVHSLRVSVLFYPSLSSVWSWATTASL
jgi:hypothetical protein